MKEFPKPEVYEQFYKSTPWGILIKEVISIIITNAPNNALILDLMCGTGYLLNEIKRERNDLVLEGIDLNEVFVNYATNKYPSLSFQNADAIQWETEKKYDIVICTGGLHHLPLEHKKSFLQKVSKLTSARGFAILADPYLDDYSNELERKQAAAKLGYEYLKSTIENDAPNDVIQSTIDILYNDVLALEFKTSVKRIEPLLSQYFTSVEIRKAWQNNQSEFGDYYIICSNFS